MKLEFPRQIFEKCLYVRFFENPSKGETSCSKRTDRKTPMTKLRVAFCRFCESTYKFYILPTHCLYLFSVSEQTGIIFPTQK